MKYQVRDVQGATNRRLGEGEAVFPRTVEEVKEEIHSIYMAAQDWGGKVVAGYTLHCEPHEGLGSDEPSLQAASDFLFLVMELPDDFESRQ